MATLYKARQPLDVDAYRIRDSLYGNVWKMSVNPKFENGKIVVIGAEASSGKTVPQSSGWLEQATRVEPTSLQRNTKGKRMVRYNVLGVVGIRHGSKKWWNRCASCA